MINSKKFICKKKLQLFQNNIYNCRINSKKFARMLKKVQFLKKCDIFYRRCSYLEKHVLYNIVLATGLAGVIYDHF